MEPEVHPPALSPLIRSPADLASLLAHPRPASRAPRGPPHLDPSAPPGLEQIHPPGLPPGARFMLGNHPGAGFQPGGGPGAELPPRPPPGAGFQLNLQFHPNQ